MPPHRHGGALYIIPHTHWEGAVFTTREAYLDLGLPNILRALALLRAYPHYRFTLDQACYVKPFLERYPEQEADFRRFIAQGRLAIVGGTDVMLDVNMPGGESFVRQVLYGKGYFRRRLGVEVTVGWQLDTFGHHAQMPQLLRLSGLRSFWFFRGVPNWDTPTEFLWEGLDGTRIPAFWLPFSYAHTYGSPPSMPDFGRFMEERYADLARCSQSPVRVGLAGADVCAPEEHLPALVEEYNRQPAAPVQLHLATPQEYEAVALPGDDAPVVAGELNPIFQGIYSSRIELKQQTRRLENVLTTAEKLGVLLDFMGLPTSSGNGGPATASQSYRETGAGAPFPSSASQAQVHENCRENGGLAPMTQPYGESGACPSCGSLPGSVLPGDDWLWEAWERVLFNQAHDLMSGVMTDHVYEDTQHSYDFARRLGEQALESRLRQYCAGIDTRGDGLALVVFNALGIARTDVVVARVGFSTRDVMALRVVGPAGQPVPAQILRSEHYGSGGLVEADIAFIAGEVPGLGHCVYRVLPAEPGSPGIAVHGTRNTDGMLENGLYRVCVDPRTGALTSVVTVADGREILDGPGNVVVQEPDHGDLWEPYRPLDGASRIAMKEEHPVPPRGQAVYSNEQSGEVGDGFAGPVMSQFTVTHDFGPRGRFSTTVRLYAGVARIEIHTRILNHDEFVRYRVLFPTTIRQGQTVHEIPFGALARPCGIEFPAQNWVDWSDGACGLALLNRGLPGNATHQGTLVLSLLRSTRIVAYGFGGGYEPGMTSDTGLELGKELSFDYALVPHTGDWKAAWITRHGLEFNSPLMVHSDASHPGPLPARWGFLQVEPQNLVLSALKRSEQGTAVLRVYEAAGQATMGAVVRLPASVRRVQETDLLEDPVGELPVAAGEVRLNLRPFEIKTLRFQVPTAETGAKYAP